MKAVNHTATFLLLMIFSLSGAPSFAVQEWNVPEDNKNKVAPFLFTPDNKQQGEQQYKKNCQSCHGYPGKNDWAKLEPPPGDPAAPEFQNQSDGEMFYKITTGKTPMPEFRNVLTEDDRWNIIAFIRSFNANYVQPDPAQVLDLTGRRIKLYLMYDSLRKNILVRATESDKDKTERPATGIEVMLLVKRYFGNMPVGEPVRTNDAGIAAFNVPAEIPGDSAGVVDLVAMLNDPTGKLGESQSTLRAAVGKPVHLPALNEPRAWWNTRDKAPIWVIAVYTSAVLIVWGFIFYIIFMVWQIRKL